MIIDGCRGKGTPFSLGKRQSLTGCTGPSDWPYTHVHIGRNNWISLCYHKKWHEIWEGDGRYVSRKDLEGKSCKQI